MCGAILVAIIGIAMLAVVGSQVAVVITFLLGVVLARTRDRFGEETTVPSLLAFGSFVACGVFLVRAIGSTEGLDVGLLLVALIALPIAVVWAFDD